MSNLKINLQKFFSVRGIALILALSSTLSLAGCGKKAECDITGDHAHKYTNEDGYTRYVAEEYISYEGYDRSDEYITIEGEKDLYEFMDKKNLLRIDDNLDLILQTQESNVDYMEYRYKYIFMQPIPHIMRSGKTTFTYFTYIPQPRYSWTVDPNRSNLTGEERLCHYVYTAYKIEKDDKGKYVLIPSPDVDDITTVMDEYPYITKKFYKTVNVIGEELDYEDGREEDLTEEEKQRIEEYEQEQSNTNEDVKKLIKKNLE